MGEEEQHCLSVQAPTSSPRQCRSLLGGDGITAAAAVFGLFSATNFNQAFTVLKLALLWESPLLHLATRLTASHC